MRNFFILKNFFEEFFEYSAFFRQADGLLLYNGPMGNNNTFGQADYKDYVVIRLVGGRVQANLMFNGIVANPIQVAGSDALNDGKWHTVSLTQEGKVGVFLDVPIFRLSV